MKQTEGYANLKNTTMNSQARIERFILDELLLGASRTRIELDEPLISTGVIDSLAMLRLITFIEEDLGVKISDGDVLSENFDTLRRIVGLIEWKKNVSGDKPVVD